MQVACGKANMPLEIAAVTLQGVMLSLLLSGTAAAETPCITAQAKAAFTCEGKKLRPSAKRVRVPYAASTPAPGTKRYKPLAPANPPRNTISSGRSGRSSNKQGYHFLLREIALVSQLNRDTPRNSREKPQLVRRLADNYAELESDLYLNQLETEALSRQHRRAAPARSRRLAKKGKRIARQVARARRGAIRNYRRLAKRHKHHCLFPNRQRAADRGCADQVLYYLAYEYELAKKYDKARDVYLQIVTSWPKSQYVPHAYLAFGELYFNEAQGNPARWALAQQAYEKVLAFPAPANKLWGYASYKLAYVHWNQGAHDEAVSQFQNVIAFARTHASFPNAKGLMRSARRDIIPVYAMVGKAPQAYGFFLPLSGDTGKISRRTYRMLEDLGQAWIDTGRYSEARALYVDLKKRHGGAKSCGYQAKISQASIAIAGGSKQPVIEALDDQLADYLNNRDGGYGRKTRHACANHTASLLAETAMAWHLEAVGSGGVRGTGDKATMVAAAKLYAMVDDNFTRKQFDGFRFPRIVKNDWPTLASLRYAHADLLWERKAWKRCGRAFYRAFEADPNGKNAAEALFASGECWQNVVLQANGENTYQVAQSSVAAQIVSYQPRKLTDDTLEMLQAFDRYACRIVPPKHDEDAMSQYCDVKFARARAYFEARHYDKAALAFRDIALNHAGCQASGFAANLYLKSMEMMRRRWSRDSCVDRMHADAPKLASLHCQTQAQRDEHPEQCFAMARVERDLARLAIERDVASVKKGDKDAVKKLAAAGDRYWKLWQAHGRKACAAEKDDGAQLACEGYDEILHNAAAAYDGARLLAKAMSVRRVLIDPRYSLQRSPLGRRAVYDLGANHQAIAVYDMAARFYERFATESPRLQKAPVALSDAVVLRLGLGDSAKALADAKLFSRLYGHRKPRQAAQIAFAIGAHHVERGAWHKAGRALGGALSQIEKHTTPDIRVQSYALLGRVHERLEQVGKANKYYGKARAAAPKLAAHKRVIDELDEPKRRRERRYAKLVTAVGEALNYFANTERDKASSIAFPKYTGAGSATDVNRFVNTRLTAWLTRKKPALERATRRYLLVVDLNGSNPPPRWAIAAGAAVGNMWASLVRDFENAPYPKKWDQPGFVPGVSPPLLWAELKASYKAAMLKQLAPFQKVAKNAQLKCLRYGLRYQHFDDAVRGCEKWLGANYPSEFHLIEELVSMPTRSGSGLDERLQPLDVDGSRQAGTTNAGTQ